jgi:hypothetical protein
MHACMHACTHIHTVRVFYHSYIAFLVSMGTQSGRREMNPNHPYYPSRYQSINQSINQNFVYRYNMIPHMPALYCTVLCSNAQHNIPVQYITALHSQHYLSMNVQCIPVSYNILLCIPNIIIIYECASVPFRPCVYILVTTY